ncbi:hypothetical protein GBAR_LOCUS30922 [Geodia barretti]|uniref:Uncharacterized protein n=1 Tax=Geodia barretti TaxID=519541 RepID=A0AA35U037_GEOBA|nr:hypothetical protein GBAR_LOCUS30922 [Geodia barretti]
MVQRSRVNMICGDEGEGLGSRLTPTPTENIESSAVVKIQRAFRNFLGKKKVVSQLSTAFFADSHG